MSDFSMLQANLQGRLKSRSMGLKLIVVCALAVAMLIPAIFVNELVGERTRRAEEVAREISGYVGGQQNFLGPTLTIPYVVPAQFAGDIPKRGLYVVFPAQASGVVKVKTEERRRSLFKVPVFQADLNFDSQFDLTGVPMAAPAGAELEWSHAELVVGVSDPRGALADATMAVNGKTETLVPAENIEDVSANGGQHLTFFATHEMDTVRPGGQFRVQSALRFSGAQRIAILAFGKTTHVLMEGDWPDPSFDGGFLPVKRTVTPQGFTGEWSVPFIARGVRAEGRQTVIAGLGATALGVSFVELADPYQSVNRSLKYALLFLGLLFLSYFIFEVTTGKRVHPAQYVLVGFAQIIFYLLLLSLSERVGFGLGFLLAGAATVILLSANAGWIFESRAQGGRALVCFSLLYALIYMLLRLEDNALLVGAIASFAAVAAAMYFTRKIDWYSSLPVTSLPGEESTPASPNKSA